MSAVQPNNTTLGDLLNAAGKASGKVGLGQTLNGDDTLTAWQWCQWMLQEWQQKRWLVYHLVTYSIVSTGAESYTFGPGGEINTNQVAAWEVTELGVLSGGTGYAVNDTITLTAKPASGTPTAALVATVTAVTGGVITAVTVPGTVSYPGPLPNTWTQYSTTGVGLNATFAYPTWTEADPIATVLGSQRPAKLEAAFLRQIQATQPNQPDYPLRILQAAEDYAKLPLKSLQAFTGAVFLDSQIPLGIVRPYPVPQASQYSLNLVVVEQLGTQFASLSTALNLPFEYYSAIVLNLGLRLRIPFQIPSWPGDVLPGQAKNSLNVLRGPNTQIAQLVMPRTLLGKGNYNIFSDMNS